MQEHDQHASQSPSPPPSPRPSDIADAVPQLELAGRGERLGAAIIDGLLMMAIVLPLMYFSGYFTGMMSGVKPSFATQAMWGGLGFVIFAAVQGVPLANHGQTWGKKLLKMKIVDLSGALPDFGRLLLLRYGIGAVISIVPFLGSFYWIVDSLFIFRDDRRCIHDLLAGTRVVVAR